MILGAGGLLETMQSFTISLTLFTPSDLPITTIISSNIKISQEVSRASASLESRRSFLRSTNCSSLIQKCEQRPPYWCPILMRQDCFPLKSWNAVPAGIFTDKSWRSCLALQGISWRKRRQSLRPSMKCQRWSNPKATCRAAQWRHFRSPPSSLLVFVAICFRNCSLVRETGGVCRRWWFYGAETLRKK